MRIIKGYKYRIYPTKDQKAQLEQIFGSVRWVWNWGLESKKNKYLEDKSQLYYIDLAKNLTCKKRDQDFIWLKKSSIHALQQSLMDLDKSFTSFFKKKTKFPRFKSKQDKQSFRIPVQFKLVDNKLKLPKLTPIKITQHREFGPNHKLLNVTISKNKSNQYFAAFNVEEDKIIKPKNNNRIGIDLGLDNLITTSNGKKIPNPRIAKKYRSELTYRSKQLSKKVKGSNNRNRARLALARIYQKISNVKSDYVHKITSKIIDENQVIVLEDLNVLGLMKNHRLARSIADVSWGEIIRQLSYKAEWNDRELIKIDRFFPSSKLCGSCGYINQNLKLQDRTWTCHCGTIHDRDINAAKNILNQGIKSSGCRQQSEVKQKHGEALGRVSEQSERDTKSKNHENLTERGD